MSASGGCDVIVVGAGAIGCSAAYFLAGEGLSVRLLERGEVAGEASGVAAGMLTPLGEAEPVERLGFEGLVRFPELCERLRELSGIDPEFEPSGALRVAESQRELEALRKLGAECGAERPELELEWLSPEDALLLEPALATQLHGALWSPHEAHVRSSLLTRAFCGAARSLGAQVEEGVAVRDLIRSGDTVTGVRSSAGDIHSGHVIVCTGPWASELSSWLPSAPSIPIEPVRGQILALDAPSPPIRSIVWGSDSYLVPKRDGSVLVGASEERVGFDRGVTSDGMNALLSSAPRLVPALARSRFRGAEAGLRPGSPDGLPAISPLPGIAGLSLAAGHFRNGILLAPYTGRLLTELVLGKADPDELAVFDPARWTA